MVREQSESNHKLLNLRSSDTSFPALINKVTACVPRLHAAFINKVTACVPRLHDTAELEDSLMWTPVR